MLSARLGKIWRFLIFFVNEKLRLFIIEKCSTETDKICCAFACLMSSQTYQEGVEGIEPLKFDNTKWLLKHRGLLPFIDKSPQKVDESAGWEIIYITTFSNLLAGLFSRNWCNPYFAKASLKNSPKQGCSFPLGCLLTCFLEGFSSFFKW